MPDIKNNLYPPIVDAVMPAFIYNRKCKIYFSISDFNTLSSQSSSNNETTINEDAVQVTVQKQNNNQNVLNYNTYPNGIKITSILKDTNTNQYYIEIDNVDIQNGFNLNQYYKVQIRFTGIEAAAPPQSGGLDQWLNENLEYFSEWSTVTLIYGVSWPMIILKDFVSENVTASFDSNNITILGHLYFTNQADKEKMQRYKVTLYNTSQDEILQESENIYTNNLNNPNEINYTFLYNLEKNIDYKFKIQFLTKNGYSQISPFYSFNIPSESSIPTISYNIDITTNNSTGCIKINFDNNGSIIPSNTIFKILRTSNIERDFKIKREIATIKTTKPNKKIIWSDYSIQPGVWYKYYIIQYNNTNEEIGYSEIENSYMINTEDIFLIADNKQLKIRFDPQISNYSIKHSESITETIGSKYPFIIRNGNMKYITFSLSGTISYFSDLEQNLFKSSKENLFGNAKNLYQNYNQNNNISIYNDYILEREFRKKVIDFLYQNNIKLFRSLTEGNLLVKLTNISLTPNNTLGRMIYSFSCDVNQIDDNTYDNYKKYNVLLNNIIQID